jgi:hypothetical protein
VDIYRINEVAKWGGGYQQVAKSLIKQHQPCFSIENGLKYFTQIFAFKHDKKPF